MKPDPHDVYEWRHLDGRLRLMEEWARRALKGGWPMATTRRPAPVSRPPVLLPSRWGSVLYGADGKPMKEI